MQIDGFVPWGTVAKRQKGLKVQHQMYAHGEMARVEE